VDWTRLFPYLPDSPELPARTGNFNTIPDGAFLPEPVANPI